MLNKIRYFSLSRQTKHLGDIAGVLAISPHLVDQDYITMWCELLGLTDTWQEMQKPIADMLDREL